MLTDEWKKTTYYIITQYDIRYAQANMIQKYIDANKTINSSITTIYMTNSSTPSFKTKYQLSNLTQNLLQVEILSKNVSKSFNFAQCLTVILASYVGNPVYVGDKTNKIHYSIEFKNICRKDRITDYLVILSEPENSFNSSTNTTLVVKIQKTQDMINITNPACFIYNTQIYEWSKDNCTYDSKQSSSQQIVCNCVETGVIRIDEVGSSMDKFGGYQQLLTNTTRTDLSLKDKIKIAKSLHAVAIFLTFTFSLFFIFQCVCVIDKRRKFDQQRQERASESRQSSDFSLPANNQIPGGMTTKQYIISYSLLFGPFVESQKLLQNVALLNTLWVSFNIIFGFTGTFYYLAYLDNGKTYYESGSNDFVKQDMMVGIMVAVLALFSRTLNFIQITFERVSKYIVGALALSTLGCALCLIIITFNDMPESYFDHWLYSFITANLFHILVFDPILLAILRQMQKKLQKRVKYQKPSQVAVFENDIGQASTSRAGFGSESSPEKKLKDIESAESSQKQQEDTTNSFLGLNIKSKGHTLYGQKQDPKDKLEEESSVFQKRRTFSDVSGENTGNII